MSDSVSTPSSYQATYGFTSTMRSSDFRLNKRITLGRSENSAINESMEQIPTVISSRNDEKIQLGHLNDRFAAFIDKVGKLELHNKQLTVKIAELEARRNGSCSSGDMFEDELNRLRNENEHLSHDKAKLTIQLNNCVYDLNEANKSIAKREQERQEAEQTFKELRKDVDDATLAKMDADKKIELIRDELELLRAEKNETWDLQEQLKTATQIASKAETDAVEARRKMQSLATDLKSQKTTNVTLQTKISTMTEQWRRDSEETVVRIGELEENLQTARNALEDRHVEYDKLMDSKLSLDQEIGTYRRLLDGGEGKITRSNNDWEKAADATETSDNADKEEKKSAFRKFFSKVFKNQEPKEKSPSDEQNSQEESKVEAEESSQEIADEEEAYEQRVDEDEDPANEVLSSDSDSEDANSTGDDSTA